MANEDRTLEDNPLIIIAQGIAIGLALVGSGYCLKLVTPVIATAIGLVIAIIGGGMVTSSFTWVVPAAGVGLAITGGATGIFVLANIVKEAKKNQYEWLLPILAVISGLVIDSCKQLYQTESTGIRIIYAGSVSCLYLLGGILWQQKKVKFKVISSRIVAVIPSFYHLF